MLVNVPVMAGADCKVKSGLVLFSTRLIVRPLKIKERGLENI